MKYFGISAVFLNTYWCVTCSVNFWIILTFQLNSPSLQVLLFHIRDVWLTSVLNENLSFFDKIDYNSYVEIEWWKFRKKFNQSHKSNLISLFKLNKYEPPCVSFNINFTKIHQIFSHIFIICVKNRKKNIQLFLST